MGPSVSVRLLLTQSDARLVELARAGHERAFEALVERYRRPLLGYCRRLLLPHERAEDALQQGLLQAWLALRDGTEVRDVKPWLYRIVHHAALNMLRRSGYNYAELSETLSGAGAPAEDLDRRIAVREALAGLAALPEMQREALLRTAVDGRSYEEAAAALGLSEGAVRGLVHRARVTLRTATTALTPAPLLSWWLGSGSTDAPLASRLAEVGAGSGSAGVAGVLLKATAAAVTAGIVVGGVSASHRPHVARDRHSHRPAPALVTARAVGYELALGGGHPASGSGAEPAAPGAPPRRSPAVGVRRKSAGVPQAGRAPQLSTTPGDPRWAGLLAHGVAPVTLPDAPGAHAGEGSGDRKGEGSGDHAGRGEGGEGHQGPSSGDGGATSGGSGASSESPDRHGSAGEQKASSPERESESGSKSDSESADGGSGEGHPSEAPQGSTAPDSQRLPDGQLPSTSGQ